MADAQRYDMYVNTVQPASTVHDSMMAGAQQERVWRGRGGCTPCLTKRVLLAGMLVDGFVSFTSWVTYIYIYPFVLSIDRVWQRAEGMALATGLPDPTDPLVLSMWLAANMPLSYVNSPK